MTTLTTITMEDGEDFFDIDVTYDDNLDGTCTPLFAKTQDGQDAPQWVWDWLWGPYGQHALTEDRQGRNAYEREMI